MAANDDTKQMAKSLTNSPPTELSPNKLPPTLFTIPAELRNEIYRLALVKTNRYWFCEGGYSVPGALQVYRQMRDEGSSIYYGENTFVACDYSSEREKVQVTKERIERFGGKAMFVAG